MVDDRRLLRALEGVRSDDHDTVAPPPRVWAAIAGAALGQPGPAAPEEDPRDRVAAAMPRTAARPWARWGRGLAVAAGVAAVGVTLLAQLWPVARTAELEPLDASVAAGAATVVRGQLHLDVELDPPPDGHHEVWLLSPDATRTVSLGVVRDDGRYDLPAGVYPADVPVVDVSVEPDDGDPAHSGTSVLRGQLS